MFIIGGIASIMSDGRPQSLGASTLTSIVGGRIFGVPVIAVWAVLVLLLCIALVHGTVFGSYLYAIGDGERVAGMTGVPVKKIKVATFAISGLLAGFGGILLAVRTSSGAPGMGDSFLLDSIAAIVMGGTSLTGGVGGPRRTVLGVLVIVVLANGMTLTNVDPFYQVVIRGAVVIGAVALTIKRSELDLVK
jgi:ribose transport system permease protein/putative xylitol transport system permease protein